MKPLRTSNDKFSNLAETLAKIQTGGFAREKYIDLLATLKADSLNNESSEQWRMNNLEADLRACDWVCAKVKNKSYAQNLYAALCNNLFVKNEVWEILKDTEWSCSWRHAGSIIADMREEGDYMDWYCSGIKQTDWSGHDVNVSLVSEGWVTDEIREDLFKLGWLVKEQEE